MKQLLNRAKMIYKIIIIISIREINMPPQIRHVTFIEFFLPKIINFKKIYMFLPEIWACTGNFLKFSIFFEKINKNLCYCKFELSSSRKILLWECCKILPKIQFSPTNL